MAAYEEFAKKQVPERCQRIGCDAMFTEDNNPDGSCRYHPSFQGYSLGNVTLIDCKEDGCQDKGPIFHDGMKEWSCCKQRSHDFSLFLEIPGCQTGKHTSEKPVKVISSTPKATPVGILNKQADNISNKQNDGSCSRCRQGFFCSDHGSEPKPSKPATSTATAVKGETSTPKRKINLNEPQTCRNKGCGKKFTEKDNHDTACEYHPGPPVFHDRKRGWKCCDIYVNEFDEFMNIAPCAKGWHNANTA